LSKITSYAALASPQSDDALVIVDTHDSSQDPSGTTKQMPVSVFDTRYLRAGGTLTESLSVSGALFTPPVTLTDGTSVAVNAALSNMFRLTPGGNRTIANPSNPSDGQTIVFEIIQDATGSRTLAWDTGYSFPASIGTPVLSSTPAFHDFIVFRYDSGTAAWYCVGFTPQQSAATALPVSQGGTGKASLTAYELVAAGTTATGALQQVGSGTAGQVLTSAGSSSLPSFQAVPGQFLCSPSQYAPGAGATLTTTSATLSAVSTSNVSTGSFTAPASGSVLVTANPQVVPAGTGVNYSFALAASGTVTPVIGNVYTSKDGSVSTNFTRVLSFIVTGLTAGTSYNLDLLFATASGTLGVEVLGQSSTTPTGSIGSPLVMTVQAI
jgi:hypothetical protein